MTTPRAKLLTPVETAEILGTTVGTLAWWRSTKAQNIPYVKRGRSVMYDPADVEAWIASRKVVSAY